ncbi:MAG TPA: protein kinase [Armatimonadota bacterium]
MEAHGLDAFDPATGRNTSYGTDAIAYRFIGTDYPGNTESVGHDDLVSSGEPGVRLTTMSNAEVGYTAFGSRWTVTVSSTLRTDLLQVFQLHGEKVRDVYGVRRSSHRSTTSPTKSRGSMARPAERLEGLILDGGWRVISAVPRSVDGTGGNFSSCYVVHSDRGQKAFLKAVDFQWAMQQDDPMRALQYLTEAFNFERDILCACRDKRLDRVVHPLADGSVVPPGGSSFDVVHYIIFDLADGDIRAHAAYTDQFEVAWALRCLHHVATGLEQLHDNGMAHQDLKPSNVLVFNESTSKLTDLGRAALKGRTPPHHNYPVAGDRSYAPPELLYGYIDPDWNPRRCGCDAYHLGSMAVYFFTGQCMTALLTGHLHPDHHFQNWRADYREVLPYVRDAFDLAVDDFAQCVPEDLRDELTLAVQQLCDPDPGQRGHPRARASRGNPFSLNRYVSLFNRLAEQQEFRLRHRQP